MKKPVTLERHRLYSNSAWLQALQSVQQRLVLLCSTNGDTQELGDALLLEMTHDHALLAQPGRQGSGILVRMTGEDEIGCRRQYFEAQPLQPCHHRFAAGDHLLAGLFEIVAILECRRRTGD